MTTTQKMAKKNYLQGDGEWNGEIMVHTVNNQKEKRKIIAKELFTGLVEESTYRKNPQFIEADIHSGQAQVVHPKSYFVPLFSTLNPPLADHYFVPNLLLFFVLFWNCPDFSLRVRLGVFIFKKLF